MSDEHDTQRSTTPTPTTLKPSSPSPLHNPLKVPTEDGGGDDDDCNGIDDDDGYGEPEDVEGIASVEAAALEPDDGAGVKTAEELEGTSGVEAAALEPDDGAGVKTAEELEGTSGVEAAALEPDDGAGVKTKPLSTSEPLVSANLDPTTTSTATAGTLATKIVGTVQAYGPAAKSPPNGKDVPEEYQNGYISCQVCGLQVDIRDRETGKFTVRMWDEHRERCFPNSSSTTSRGVPASSALAPPAAPGDLTFAPETTAQSTHAPTKRRRAKRTEEERIDYLRADPYIAQFEAYKVLCALCDKWIRLRPNSTYCSIPWDAHRKSCLAKNTNKSAYALHQRNSLFSKDPDIRKFDAERVLCMRCDKWLLMPPEDHDNAMQKWLNHRAECNKNVGPPSPSIVQKTEIPGPPPLSETSHQLASLAAAASSTATNPSSPKSRHHQHQHPSHQHHHNLRESHAPTASSSSAHHRHHSSRYSAPHPYANGRGSQQCTSPFRHPTTNAREHHHPTANASPSPATPCGPSSPSPTPSYHTLEFHDMRANLNSYAPIHKSRQRNAEQREARLRADRYIEEVEPNRVFCKLCSKWVQLRQDSSFCAYPWVQHRGKCLARLQRQGQRAVSIADFKRSVSVIRQLNPIGVQNANADGELDELMSDLDASADDAHHDNNEGAPSPARGHNTRANGRRKVKPSPSSSSSSSSSDSEHDDDEGEGDDAEMKRETKRRRLDGPSTSSGRGYMPHHHPPLHSGPGRLDPLPSSSSGVRRSSYNAAHPQTQNYASPYTVNSSSPFVRRLSGGKGGWRNSRDREREYMLRANENGHQGDLGGSRPGTGYSSTSSSSRHLQQQRVSSHRQQQQQAYQQRERGGQWDHEMDQEDVDVVDVDVEGEVVDDVDPEGEIVEVEGGISGEAYASRPASSGANGHHHQHTSNGRDQEVSAREKHILGAVRTRPPRYQHPANGRRGQERMLAVMRRPGPVGLADLDSVGGRKKFLASSILHLLTTTYEPTDDLPISSLLTYLNAAMPVDKHEDFDTAEVVKYVVALSGTPAGSAGFGVRTGEGWRVVLEGDIVRILDTRHMIS